MGELWWIDSVKKTRGKAPKAKHAPIKELVAAEAMPKEERARRRNKFRDANAELKRYGYNGM